MPYEPPPSVWMPGKEAIVYIRTIKKCTTKRAIEQLRLAIVHRAVGAMLADMKQPPIDSSPISVPSDSIPTREMWKTAQIKANGTVLFSDADSPRVFQVIRENVLRIWAKDDFGHLSAKPFRKSAPVKTAVLRAINQLWPDGIPAGLKAKERNRKIAAQIKLNEDSIPSDGGLARAVQRAIKSEQIT